MPLYGDDGQGGMLDAFDDVIAGAADGQQIFARPVEGLMMGGVNRGAETVQLIEEIGAGQAAVIDVVLLIRAVPLVGSGSGDMLDDGTAEGDVDDLHPLTDAEDRFFMLIEQIQCAQLFQCEQHVGKRDVSDIAIRAFSV